MIANIFYFFLLLQVRYQQQRNQGKNLSAAQQTISVVLLDEVGM